jgi:uncharacterized protein (DUF2236 family)
MSAITSAIPARSRERVNHSLRRAIGLTDDPPAACDDPQRAYRSVDGVARIVHGDLPSMLVGGLASLFLEMLHPYSMAGVAQHSRYRDDPLGRVRQTAHFIGLTTYGSRDEALAAIERVRTIHEYVHGVADDGVPYRASDPRLLEWVHVAGTAMFLAAHQRFGATPLSAHQYNRYVAEQAIVGRDLGVPDPPQDVAQLRAVLEGFRPELRLSEDAIVARDFLVHGVVRGARQRAAYALLVRSAFGVVPNWGRRLLDVPAPSAPAQLALDGATRTLGAIMRVAVPPYQAHDASVRPPSTTTT